MTKQLIAATVSATLVGASVGGCVGGPSSPTAPTTVNVTHTPGVGATVANGDSYEIRVDVRGNKGTVFETVAFVRDDGLYSAAFMCGESRGSGDGSGASGYGTTHDVRNPVDTLNFAVGRRVNLVVLYSSRGPCIVGPGAPTVDPSQADLGRKDVTLNWLVGG